MPMQFCVHSAFFNSHNILCSFHSFQLPSSYPYPIFQFIILADDWCDLCRLRIRPRPRVACVERHIFRRFSRGFCAGKNPASSNQTVCARSAETGLQGADIETVSAIVLLLVGSAMVLDNTNTRFHIVVSYNRHLCRFIYNSHCVARAFS